MKLSIALLGAAVVATAAQPAKRHTHGHNRMHKAKRDPQLDTAVNVNLAEVVYILNGVEVSPDEVAEGLKNGTFIVRGHHDSTKPGPAAIVPLPSAKPSNNEGGSASDAKPPPPPTKPSSNGGGGDSVAKPSPSKTPSSYGGGGGGGGSGLDTDFPDGKLSCDVFPSQYGPVPIEAPELQGWTGVQVPGPGSNSDGYDNIVTVAAGGSCTEGAFCSYACPPGTLKSQWPSKQGLKGQSVGGLQCSGGKLRLTNPGLSTKLCIRGTDKVDVRIQNTLSQNVAVCGTDYPGTESETIPINVEAGATSNVACPDAADYYSWKGGKTSLQFYVNYAGFQPEKACLWATPESKMGNFAPLNMGVGYSNGAAWLSIFQNAPTTDAKLDFTVEIVGDELIGSCKYSNGQYCSENGCSSTTGCTVSLSSGTATFVFSES